MRSHNVTLYVVNGRNYCRCRCGWLTEPTNIEKMLEEAEAHKLEVAR